MKIPKELYCRKCPKMFCCVDCRVLHEQKTHNLSGIDEQLPEDIECPICQNEQFILKSDISTTLIEHILQLHMPLRCNKCSKIYTTLEDLLCFSKCFKDPNHCGEGDADELSKASMDPQTSVMTISTQTSPYKVELDSNQISMINMKWKVKTTSVRESIGGSNEFISDSVSSLKNISSISNSSLRRSIDINTTLPFNKGKLVRTTSTPLPSEVFLSNPKVHTNYHYQSTEHLSSIHHSANELDESNAVVNQIFTPSCSKIQRYQKVRPRTLKPPVTPLRQVMSKSIQKAIAEHGNIYSPNKGKQVINRSGSLGSSSPVDLRMSPVIRRTQSEVIETSHLDSISEISSQDSVAMHRSLHLKKQSESIRVVRMRRTSFSSQCSNSNPSVYKTCESVEIITETSETSGNLHSTAITPKVPRTTSGKMIDFFEGSESILNAGGLDSPNNFSSDDVFYTPKSSPKHKTVFRFANKPKPKGKQLWSLVSSVLGYKGPSKEDENVDSGNSLLKRCASFAGSLMKPKNIDNEPTGFKRKRCHTESECSMIKSPVQSNSSKRVRIQARRPIDRMRQNSLCID
ncbi:hypothetical protein ACFFRR_000270 [Megaselia abdita]